jgi:hypothetical protein
MEENDMESTERSVSSETALFPDGTTDDEKRILEILSKAKVREDRHMTKERIVHEMGAHGHAVNGLWKTVDRLCNKRMVIERTDPLSKETVYRLRDAEDLTCKSCGFVAVSHQGLAIHKGFKHAKASGTEFYAPKPKETSVLEQKHDKGHRGKTAETYQKIKNLFERGHTYEQMSDELGIPRGTISSVLFRMFKDGQVRRRNRVLSVTTSEPKTVEIEIHDSKDEEEDDEPKVLEHAQPEVSEILKAFENGANEIRRMGWAVEVQVKLSYPVAMHRGAS